MYDNLTSFPLFSGGYASGYDYSSGGQKPSEDSGGTLFVSYEIDPSIHPILSWDIIKQELDWRFFNKFFPYLFGGWVVCKLEYVQWFDVDKGNLVCVE